MFIAARINSLAPNGTNGLHDTRPPQKVRATQVQDKRAA
jgi:hypothetical protein